jgi:hypothetical protein
VKAPSPLLGFNNNVRHKGRVFHIQTEDSGIRHPHIITHLFADGGRILKTTKTSYAEHIGEERLNETVRGMMQEQHKAMFIALRDGQFDALFEESAPASSRLGARSAPKPPPSESGERRDPDSADQPAPASTRAPLVPPPLAPPRPAPRPLSSHAEVQDVIAVPSAPEPASPRKPPPPVPRPRTPEERAPMAMAMTEPARAAVPSPPPHAEHATAEAPEVPPVRRGAQRPKLDVDPGAIHGVPSGEPSIDLDLDALERAAAEAQTPFFQQIQDLPPPPASVLGNKRSSTGGYSVRSPAPPPPLAGRPESPIHAPRAPALPSTGRYAPSRPAAIFANTRPQEGASIFGEDLISEKSLDEVILSYLAEDLDGPADKK